MERPTTIIGAGGATPPRDEVTGGATALEVLSAGVRAVATSLSASGESVEQAWAAFELTLETGAGPLSQLVRRFGLVGFDVRCLMLALASHVDPQLPTLIEQSGTSGIGRVVTVRLALDKLCPTPESQMAARRSFLPSAPLLANRLVLLGRTELGAADGLLGRRLDLAAPTVRYLLDEDELSDTVARFARIERPAIALQNVIIDAERLRQAHELIQLHGRYREVVTEWGFDKVLPHGRAIVMLFAGPSGTGKTLLAQALAGSTDRTLLSVSAADLPERDGIDAALRDLFAEAALRDAILLIDECEALLAKGDRRRAAMFLALDDFDGIVVMTTNHPEQLDDALERRITFQLAFEAPSPEQRRQIWEVHLPPDVPLEPDVDLDTLSNLYDFTGGTIKNAILIAVNRALARRRNAPRLAMADLDEGCRSQLRYALEELTVRTTTHLRMRDIVLPGLAARKVREILSACRNHSMVMNAWGLGRRLVTGKGITVLFDGAPGTGKTYCAEIIAGELDRPLYRVNLPEVVSKWVGETEKHIRAIFQQARVCHAMLLFDEADALFASRVAEPSSSNDRYTNMEVNLLLQEIERFPGVAILTTNSFGSLDRALVRRIQFRVTFEEPTADERRRIWECLTPHELPMAPDVDFALLARRFEMTGAMIKNSLLRSAYWAAEGDHVVSQSNLIEACTDEYAAIGRVTRESGRPTARRLELADVD